MAHSCAPNADAIGFLTNGGKRLQKFVEGPFEIVGDNPTSYPEAKRQMTSLRWRCRRPRPRKSCQDLRISEISPTDSFRGRNKVLESV